ncbi:hypothetical protein GCM10010387_07520 [Streptomyces inusitatus]|uniref:Uncharacterized protein n=1 Tax=Streptomyces inusitatus TaxID=68221 RepID=A0A918UKX0_9ACTN|nr:hypothetical protein [Streptomyces inusitatus]GGZ17313.1 hypothetical protein GCM10010387_07520 [Streptomyces inusitatus]
MPEPEYPEHEHEHGCERGQRAVERAVEHARKSPETEPENEHETDPESNSERRRRRAQFLRELNEAKALRDRVQPRRARAARMRQQMRMRTFRW